MGIQLTMGTRIYRPEQLAGAGEGVHLELETPLMKNMKNMKDFGDGTIMLRAVPHEAYLPDWLVVPWETPGGRVCVCDEPILDDWTYFEVFFADVNFVAVSPVAGDPEELKQKHLEAARRSRQAGAADRG
jgi:hypothetical protein